MKEKQKTFCFVVPSFFNEYKGGAELQCYYLAQELIRRGWTIHYIREHRNQIHPNTYTFQGITIHGVKEKRNELRWLNEIQLYQIMNEIKADYWYCRASISYLHPVLKNAKKINNSMVIWACSHENELKPIKNLNPIKWLLSKFNEWLFKKALIKTHQILLQTNQQKTLLKSRYNLPGVVIYNAHPLLEEKIKSTRKNIIVWVGRLQTWKRPEIFTRISDFFMDKPYEFIAIGRPLSGNNLDEMLRNIQKQSPNFIFKGELDNAHVRQIIASAKLLVCTSLYEGFSNTFIEAWARGVPVVSLNVDPDNLIQKQNLGTLSNNFKNLCADIDLLMRDNNKWSELSTNCEQFFRDHLTITKAVDKLEMVLKNHANLLKKP